MTRKSTHHIPAANYNDQTAEYLLPPYMPQQRTIDRNFKLHVPKPPSFGPVRRQRSPTQWRPWGSKNTQTRAKSSTRAFCSGSAATDSSAGAATRGQRLQSPWRPEPGTCTMACSNVHTCFHACSTFATIWGPRSATAQWSPLWGKSCGALQAGQGTPANHAVSCYVHSYFVRASWNWSETPERVEKCVGCWGVYGCRRSWLGAYY